MATARVEFVAIFRVGLKFFTSPIEGADLDTSEVGTSPPPELDTSGHTYIRHRYIRHRYNE